MVKTAKFGGSSLSDAGQFQKVAAIVREDPARRFVVVSAPGKRFSGDDKITDLLYRCAALAGRREDFSAPFGQIRDRYLSIERDLGLEQTHMGPALDEIEAALRTGRASRDFVASRGEYLCARLMGAYLGAPMVDAAQLIRFKEDGTLDMERTACYCAPLKDLPLAVIPGFYGTMPDGSIRTFSRGGSDITGAIIARAVGASEYENWTDVDGFMMADPRIVPEARVMHAVSYTELRELSYMGASVLHEESIFPVREARIPIHVRNTNHPEAGGTWIVNEGTLMKEHRQGLLAGSGKGRGAVEGPGGVGRVVEVGQGEVVVQGDQALALQVPQDGGHPVRLPLQLQADGDLVVGPAGQGEEGGLGEGPEGGELVPSQQQVPAAGAGAAGRAGIAGMGGVGHGSLLSDRLTVFDGI